jgi:hypothetical protein
MESEKDYYMEMLNNPLSYDSYDIESAIIFFEEIKDSYRMKNQIEFEKNDILQEKFYKILENNFNIKYENIPDKWNKSKE